MILVGLFLTAYPSLATHLAMKATMGSFAAAGMIAAPFAIFLLLILLLLPSISHITGKLALFIWAQGSFLHWDGSYQSRLPSAWVALPVGFCTKLRFLRHDRTSHNTLHHREPVGWWLVNIYLLGQLVQWWRCSDGCVLACPSAGSTVGRLSGSASQ